MPEKEEAAEEEITEEQAAPTETTPTEPAEAVPPLGQEQAESEDSVDSGTPEAEDEAPGLDVRAEKLQILKDLQEGDPELVKEAFGEQEQSVDADRQKFNAEQAQTRRMGAFTQAQNTYNQYVSQNGQNTPAQIRIYEFFEQQNDAIAEAAKSLHEGELTNPGDVSLDTVKMVQAVSPLINDAVAAATNAYGTSQSAIFYNALEQSDAYASLNAEERAAFTAAEQKQSFAEAALVLIGAAQRTAPEAITRAAEKKAQEDADVLDKFAKLRSGVGNGKSATGAPPPKKPDTSTKEWAETASVEDLVRQRAEARA